MNLPESHRKALFSVSYIEAISFFDNYLAEKSFNDYGVDLTFKELNRRKLHDKFIYTNSGREIDVQIKAIKESRLVIRNHYIHYPLRIKNYLDLFDRKDSIKPLILLLFIVPDDSTSWLTFNPAWITLRKCCYYFTAENISISNNKTIQTIKIPVENVFQPKTIEKLFNQLF